MYIHHILGMMLQFKRFVFLIVKQGTRILGEDFHRSDAAGDFLENAFRTLRSFVSWIDAFR